MGLLSGIVGRELELLFKRGVLGLEVRLEALSGERSLEEGKRGDYHGKNSINSSYYVSINFYANKNRIKYKNNYRLENILRIRYLNK